MKIKCEHCGAEMDEFDKNCPYCRGENTHLKTQDTSNYNTNRVPQTIEELKQWYIAMNLPDENITRFFIGKDYKHPKAFGIYKDERTGNFVVYKNKGDGQRAVRYEGKDEAYAVNELYKKLKDEIYNQKHNNNNDNTNNNETSNRKTKKHGLDIMMIIWALIIFIFGIISYFSPRKGYYYYNDDYYYYQSGSWYEYDDDYGWRYSYIDDYFKDNYSDYYYSSGYNYNYGIDSFENSSYYIEPSSSSYDSDSSWDSTDSWDSDTTDWDSDW